MIAYKDVSVVIPAYNEENTIDEVVKGIFQVSKDFEVIVCDDGSTDKTAQLAREAGAIVIEHPYNIGNGASIKSGTQRASRKYIVFMDADLQHQPEDIPKLLEYLPDYDMVVGARTNSSKTAMHRNIGNKILNILAESISRHKIADLTSGFRAVNKRLFTQFLHLYPLTYSYPTTSTLAFFSSGYFVKYVPLSSIRRRAQGTSNISPFKDGIKFLHIILRSIMMFHPQKLFTPMAIICFLAGILLSGYQLVYTGGIRSSGIILLVSTVVMYLNGILVEQIAQIRRDMYK